MSPLQIDSFLEGFHELVPSELISIFDAQELELLISGLPDIDLDDLRAHTDYQGYKASDPEITYFWNVLKSFSKQEKALFLQFVTGTSKVRQLCSFTLLFCMYVLTSVFFLLSLLRRCLWTALKRCRAQTA